jgi:hypothetical protein
MIGGQSAAVLVIANLALTALLGIGAGGLSCLRLRRPWGLKKGFFDGSLAVVAAVIASFILSAMDSARGVWVSRAGVVLTIGATSVIAKDLVQALSRSGR